MKLTLKRISDDGDSTIGALFIQADGPYSKGEWLSCFTVEDQFQTMKVYGETRIPAGTYEIGIRKGSPMADRYDAKYPNHDGMIWIKDVPNFEWVYMHVGNDDDDTEGCVLVNNSLNHDHTGSKSVDAYMEIYPLITNELNSGKKVTIEVIDE